MEGESWEATGACWSWCWGAEQGGKLRQDPACQQELPRTGGGGGECRGELWHLECPLRFPGTVTRCHLERGRLKHTLSSHLLLRLASQRTNIHGTLGAKPSAGVQEHFHPALPSCRKISALAFLRAGTNQPAALGRGMAPVLGSC